MLSGPAQRGFPGWMVGPLAHRLPALPDSPPMLGGRPHARARDPRHRVAGGRAVRAAGARRPSSGRAVVAAHVIAAARAAAVADRRLQLPALRAHAGDLRRQSVRRPAAHRPPGPRLPLLQLAPPAVALRPALHPASPRASLRSRCPPPTGRGRACCWPPRSGPSCWSRSPRAGSAARRRPRSRSSGSTRSSSSTASAARTTSRWCCCAASPRSSLAVVGWQDGTRAVVGRRRRRLRRPGRRASSRRPPSSRPSSSSLAAGACPPWGARAAPARWSSPSSGCVYGGHLPATSIQDGLVGPLSVPNVLAALAGQGGLTPHDRVIAARRARAGRRGRDRRRDLAARLAAGRRRLRDARRRPDARLDDALVRVVGPALRRPRAHARARGARASLLTAWLGSRGDPADAEGHPSLRLLPHAHGGRAREPSLHPALFCNEPAGRHPAPRAPRGRPARALRACRCRQYGAHAGHVLRHAGHPVPRWPSRVRSAGGSARSTATS